MTKEQIQIAIEQAETALEKNSKDRAALEQKISEHNKKQWYQLPLDEQANYSEKSKVMGTEFLRLVKEQGALYDELNRLENLPVEPVVPVDGWSQKKLAVNDYLSNKSVEELAMYANPAHTKTIG